MPKFFCDNITTPQVLIDGENGAHLAKSLRIKVGEIVTLCDKKGTDYICEVKEVSGSSVLAEILESKKCMSEPSVNITLFQCMPKGDKLETVVQKAVELGVKSIVPVISSRCISRPDKASAEKKRVRLQKIADEAAGQSSRGILPEIKPTVTFKEMLGLLKDFSLSLIFYENGGKPLRETINQNPEAENIAVIIGSEGGFAEQEVLLANENGAKTVTLGRRILRTETAPLAAITSIMLLTGNLE